MASNFDPYYKWLGIPPKDQPPHHYRLLGIEAFETDRDVIDAAANRVMTYLHEVAAGDQAEHSQRLLDEIAEARNCLLNPSGKQVYDAKLRKHLESKAPPVARAEPLATVQPVAPPPPPPIAQTTPKPPPVSQSGSTPVVAVNETPNAPPNVVAAGSSPVIQAPSVSAQMRQPRQQNSSPKSGSKKRQSNHRNRSGAQQACDESADDAPAVRFGRHRAGRNYRLRTC